MSTHETLSRWRIALNTRLMDDVGRANLLAGVEKMAPQSVLLQIPAIAASYAALQAKGAKLATDSSATAQALVAYKGMETTVVASRLAFDKEAHALKTLVQTNAASAGDVTGMGFTLLTMLAASRAQPDPPGALLVYVGKAHGKARVVVAGKGYLGTFVAEVSPDPVGPTTWSALPGTGKQRKLSGYASGTKLWVRFAALRFGMLSAWSTPVLVTIP
jgi:hypothetical protein